MSAVSSFSLGATLYMSATRSDILDVVLQEKVKGLRSLVICLEDSVADANVTFALSNLAKVTDHLAKAPTKASRPLIFIRPRNIAMAKQLVASLNLSAIDGMVLPKFTLASLTLWEDTLEKTPLLWMPTLETQEVFDSVQMVSLANALAASVAHSKIIALRIGGNDLMSLIGLRRSRTSTLYEGPLGYLVKMLVCIFAAKGFSLTSPVCEMIDNQELLAKEIEQDVLHGLVGKTAIHPNQIAIIQKAWLVDQAEYEDAVRILNSNLAVFKHAGAMCEPATHRKWAERILEQCHHCGINRVNNSVEQAY